MEPINFCRKTARDTYLQSYPWLKVDERRLSLLILRSELLHKNKIFVKEWRQLEEMKNAGDGDIEKIRKKAADLFERWYVNNKGLTPPFGGHEPIVKYTSSDYKKASVQLEIDLRFPKTKILNELKFFIDYWYDLYWVDYEREVFARWCHRKGLNPEFMNKEDWEDWEFDWHNIKDGHRTPEKMLDGYVLTDLKDYEKYIDVWKLKEEKRFSWSQIKEKMDLHDIQTARNWYNAAKKLIKWGMPGFPYFPPW